MSPPADATSVCLHLIFSRRNRASRQPVRHSTRHLPGDVPGLTLRTPHGRPAGLQSDDITFRSTLFFLLIPTHNLNCDGEPVCLSKLVLIPFTFQLLRNRTRSDTIPPLLLAPARAPRPGPKWSRTAAAAVRRRGAQKTADWFVMKDLNVIAPAADESSAAGDAANSPHCTAGRSDTDYCVSTPILISTSEQKE